MRWCIAILWLATGCRYLLDGEPPAADVDGDVVIDAAPDAPEVGDEDTCGWGAGILSTDGFCLPPMPEELALPSGTTLDTSSDPRCVVATTPTGGDYCIITGELVEIAGLRVIGSRPLIVAALDRLAVAGPIDAAAHRAAPAEPAPGADPPECLLGIGPGGPRRGGAGGSFATAGGAGGIVQGSGASRATPGAATTLLAPSRLRGGCRGQSSATSAGGRGGGAIYLVARGTVVVASSINASGAGGIGGTPNDLGTGGAGGGSGGMIVLDAPTVTVESAARVFADGGGGGEGGGGQSTGASGDESTGAIAPLGGDGQAPRGGDGGDGAHGVLGARIGLNAENTGGGGGGGAGLIRLRATVADVTGTVSPAPRRL